MEVRILSGVQMKIGFQILLDLDGVMIPMKSWKAPENLEDGFPDFSRAAVAKLNELLSMHNFRLIILSSSHRHRFTREEWKKIFERRGVEFDLLVVLATEETDKLTNVQKWIQHRTEYTIIDDDKRLNGLPDEAKERLILTDPMVGLK